MLYVYPIGGIGNFLFQIAAIWTLAKDNNDELALLNIDAAISELNACNLYGMKHANAYKYIFDRFSVAGNTIAEVIQYEWDYTPLEYKNGYQYLGYFQTEKHFKHRKSELLELFRPDDSFVDAINKYSYLFNGVSLHVRRTDYVEHYSNIHPAQTIDYYESALQNVPENLKVAIFSDDLEWCKLRFIGDRYVFIDEIDYICLYIMTKMKYHIIANSSFSWWGAWLAKNVDLVICPKIWFRNNCISDTDICPDEWLKL